MSELKTLKDLNLNYEDILDINLGNPKEILKREAIKWVKSYREKKIGDWERLVIEFKDFFNLTEKEVEDE